MGKPSGSKQQVTDYKLSVHMGIATQVDELTGVYVDEKALWEGAQAPQGDIPINLPNLNGGPTKNGGCVGTLTFLPGATDQVMPQALAGRLGRTSQTCPAFRGLSSLFFTGTGGDGFLWTTNDPVVATNVSARVFRQPKGLDPGTAVIVETVNTVTITHTDQDGTTTSTTYVEGTDPGVSTYAGDTTTTGTKQVRTANPAHIIYETLTNADWGMGASPATIDGNAFNLAALTLYNEGLGLAVLWAQQTTIEDFINEIISHIQAVMFLDPRSGLLSLKLIRDDYDTSTLPHYTPDIANMSSLQRSLWGETINEISVSWTNPINEKGETVTVQDLGNIAQQGGIVSDNRNYYGVRTADLATKLAARDLRSAAAPLRSMEMVVDRSAWSTVPGDVVLVSWPEYRLSNVVMRVGKVDYGKAGDAAVKVSLLEDIFALDHPVITQAPSTAWVDPSEVPSPVDAAEIITLPAFFAMTADLQGKAIDLEYPEVLAAVLAYKQNRDTTGIDLFSPTPDATGGSGYASAGTKTITERATLTAALAAEAQSNLPNSFIIDQSRGPEIGDFLFIGHHDSDFEIALVSDYGGNVMVLSRGVLDTVPVAWPVGTLVWCVRVAERIVDEKTIRSAGESVTYKLLTRTSLGVLPLDQATPFTQTLTARPHLPLRPANVKVNGTAFGSVAAGDTLKVTWATRNRLLEDGQIVPWTDGPIAPEYRQGTVVTVRAPDGTVVYQQPGLWTENELDMPASWFARWASVSVTVSSRRDTLDSLQGATVQVTGLANNPGAAAPPAPPALTDPPSPAAAPALTAWTVSGTAVTSANGSQVPAIQIAGKQDNPDAQDLIVRHRKDSDSDWTVEKLIKLSGDYISTNVTGVAADTAYDVELAYQVKYGATGEILSKWQAYGPVTTGDYIANNVLNLHDRTTDQAISDLDFNTANIAAEVLRGALQAKVIGDLETNVNGQQQQIGLIFEVESDGTAKAILAVNVTADGKKYVSGIVDTNTGGVSDLVLVANNTTFASPDGTIQLKLVSVENGTPKARFTGDVEIDGDLLLAGTVKTLHLSDNAVIDLTSVEDASVQDISNATTVCSVTKTTTGSKVRLDIAMTVGVSGNNPADVHVSVYRDGGLIKTYDWVAHETFASSHCYFIVDNAPAGGSHTYTIQAQARGPAGAAFTGAQKQDCTVSAMEIKK